MANFGRSALFIDGENLYYTAKSLGMDLDFKRLLAEFQSHGPLLRAYYYTTVSEDAEYQTTRPLIDWLAYNGFAVTVKAAKEFDDGDGRHKFKRNVAIEIAVDMLEIASHVDHTILFSGDGDFRALVQAAQRRGVHVTVVSSMRTRPPMVADELRRQADTFIELDSLKTSICRAQDGSSMRGRN